LRENAAKLTAGCFAFSPVILAQTGPNFYPLTFARRHKITRVLELKGMKFGQLQPSSRAALRFFTTG
jgi:hypothetical protein